MADVVLFGATGYTGRLTARALASKGASFALAGRNRGKLDALAASIDPSPEIRVVDAHDTGGLVSALEGARVLVTCVGPFVELGWTAVEAALKAKVHYVDSTGEGEFIRRLKQTCADEARRAGITMAPAMGFDEVPADAAATLATEGMRRAELVLTYAVPSTGSRGTLRSILGIATAPAPWIAQGKTYEVRAGEKARWSPMPPPLGPKFAASFPLAECHLAPLHLDLERLETYATVSPARRAMLRAGLPLLRSPLRAVAERAVDRLPEGPNEQQRERGRWTVLAEARSGRDWRNVAITGTDVYGLTAQFLAAGAMKMCEEGYEPRGVAAPVQAVGLETWEKEFAANDVRVDRYEAT